MRLFGSKVCIINKVFITLFAVHTHGVIILFAVIVIARGKTAVVEVQAALKIQGDKGEY